MNGDYSHSF
jgi:hypothetical protein